MKMKIELSNKFYSKEIILKTIKEFSNVCEGNIVSDKFEIELKINEEYDTQNVIGEFKNYALSLLKNNLKKDEKINSCANLKTEYKKTPHKFTHNKTDYFYTFYRTKKTNDGYFLTTDNGNFMNLTNDEYECLKTKNFENNLRLLNKLVEENILFKDGDYTHLANQKHSKLGYLFQGPSLHIVVLTLRCNLKCVYCHASSMPLKMDGYDLKVKEARKTVDRIFDTKSNTITIEFQGGEPLLNFEMIKFIISYSKAKNEIAKKDLQFALVSNLVYMTNEILEYLIKNNVGICTSIDGPEMIHNKNRQEYEKTTTWVKKINQRYSQIKNNEKTINALPTITKNSLQYPTELVDEYLELGLNSVFLRQLNPLGTAKKNSENIFYSAEEYIDFWKTILDYIIGKNKQGKYFTEYFTKLVLKKIFEDEDPNYCELRNPCGAVTGQLLYNYDGSVFSCDEGRMLGDEMFKVGTVDDSYTQIMTNPTTCGIVAASITDTQYCDKCVYKPYCGICPVINYSTSGSVVSNIANQNRCKILKSQFEYIFDKIQNDSEAKKILLSWLKE